MKFNNVHFARIKLNALGDQGQFGEMEKMAKSKRSPAPFEHFIKVCVKAKRPDEAEKYLNRLQGTVFRFLFSLIFCEIFYWN